MVNEHAAGHHGAHAAPQSGGLGVAIGVAMTAVGAGMCPTLTLLPFGATLAASGLLVALWGALYANPAPEPAATDHDHGHGHGAAGH